MSLTVKDKPHRNWEGILKTWLTKRERGEFPPPPQHWTTYNYAPRCACCGAVLTAEEAKGVGRKAPRCTEHAEAITAIEEEFHV